MLGHLGVRLEELRGDLTGPRKPVPAGPPEQELLASLPGEVQQRVRDLDIQIDRFTAEKQGAVSASDFEKAAGLRDRCDRLRQKRQALIREALDKRNEAREDDD